MCIFDNLNCEMNIFIIDFYISVVKIWVKGEMHKGHLKISDESMVKYILIRPSNNNMKERVKHTKHKNGT